MSDEQSVPLVYEEELPEQDDADSEGMVQPIVPPPDYDASLEPITSPAPPYPGTDTELPDYCDVVTRAITNQPITDDPHNHTRPGRRVITENIQECICFAVLIGCSVVAVVSFAPLGLVALFLSIIATRKWHFYKEQSVQRKTAIGCIILAFVVGIPMHVVIWRHFSLQ